MYIPEFWCGALAVILVEIAALVGFGIYHGRKRK